MRFPRRQKPKSLLAAVLTLLVGAALAYFNSAQKGKPVASRDESNAKPTSPLPQITTPKFESQVEAPTPSRPANTPTISGDGGIGKLYREKRSNVIVTAGGTIAKVLPDDTDTSDGSSQHQRFIIRLTTGDTVLIAHNIDLAGRVPAKEGDVIRFKGEYEWTDRGGVVHWTHLDPRNRRPGGWVEFNGTRFQ